MKLNIFVSSTCYDLSQIRSDLKDFITEIGHQPLLSEDNSFPIDARKTSVENCIDTVKNYADLFILIIGDRYGYQIENDKSITNTEFLTALEKGIPIYTFTLKKMINYLSIWRDNPSGNYSNIVDSTKIFEFIDDIRSNRNLWNFQFESANDIKEIVKAQLSILFKNTLATNIQLQQIDSFLIDNLSSGALKIIMEKKRGFEVLYFFQLLQDEILKFTFLKNDYTYSLKYVTDYTKYDVKSFMSYIKFKLDIIKDYSDSLMILVNDVLKEFFAEKEGTSDLKGLFYVAHKYGFYYQEILKWTIQLNSLIIDENLEDLRSAYSLLTKDVIKELEEFPQRECLEFRNALQLSLSGSEAVILKSRLKLSICDEFTNELDLAFERLRLKEKL